MGGVVRALAVSGADKQPRSFFDKLKDWARENGIPGLGYVTFSENIAKGPIAKFLNESQLQQLREKVDLKIDGVIFFICDMEKNANKFGGQLRQKLASDLGLNSDGFEFCWVVDFPMYELNEETGAIDFSHNPFSMPQGGMNALMEMDPLKINAYQYDIICNGIELSSGAIRNHRPDVMLKAFEIAGYEAETIRNKFKGMFTAFQLGAPPHGGCAPGIDRMVMLIAEEPNIREVIAFPLNQQAQDLMMDAPAEVADKQLKELHIKLDLPGKSNLK
jgi:aspartyl-tRNA synthetase